MFSSAYCEFTLTTDPTGWEVARRFEDFQWLRNVLATLHPDILVPILPKEVNQGSLQQDLPKRKLYLRRFINAIVATPLFQRSRYVYSFLSEADNKAFTSMKKKGLREKKPERIDRFISLDGQIPVNSHVPEPKHMNRINSYLSQSEQI
jgi:sorting nexin-7/30/sorting nexin-8